VVGFCQHGNEPSVSMKSMKFLDDLSFSGRRLLQGVTFIPSE
jgi:hypothetical protein